MTTASVSRRALLDSDKSTDSEHLDWLVAQKARRYAEVASKGLRFFPAAAETSRSWQPNGLWQSAQGLCEPRSNTL